MNKSLLLAFLLFPFSFFLAAAATPTITVTLSDFTADHTGAGYVVRISPTTGGTAARALTDSDGIASFTSVTPGIYTLSIENAGVPSLQIRVPNTATTTAASSIIISAFTAPGSRATNPINATSIGEGTVSNTEFGYLNGVTSAIQTQIDAHVLKAGDTMTGTLLVTGLTNSALTASRLLVSGADKTVVSSSVTATEAGYLSGVTSALQTQINSLSGGGGDTIWTNISGIIQPVSGQLTNTLQFISGAADNATNVALVVNTASAWTSDPFPTGGPFLIQGGIGGIGKIFVDTSGSITIGEDTKTLLGNAFGSFGLERAIVIEEGINQGAGVEFALIDPDYNNFGIAQLKMASFGSNTISSTLLLAWENPGGNYSQLNGVVNQDDVYLELLSHGTSTTKLFPTVASTGSAIAYKLYTRLVQTNGDILFSVGNTTAQRFSVEHDGAITAGTTNQWKTGGVVTGASVALNATNYVTATINGATVKLALAQ